MSFLAVAECKSIRGAARLLGVTQPGVTKAMRDLESDLGVPLLMRSVEGVALTEFGEFLFVRGKLLVESIRQIEDSLIHMRDDRTGKVRIGTSATAAYRLLPETLRQFRARVTRVDLEVFEGSLSHFRPDLRDGGLDFVIANLPVGYVDEEFDVDILASFANVIGIRSSFAPESKPTLRNLQSLPWIVPSRGVLNGGHELIESFFKAHKVPLPEQIIHCESLTTALGMMSSGDLIGLFTEPLACAEFRRFGLQTLSIRETVPSGQIGLVTVRGSTPSLPVQHLMDLLHTNISLLNDPVLQGDDVPSRTK